MALRRQQAAEETTARDLGLIYSDGDCLLRLQAPGDRTTTRPASDDDDMDAGDDDDDDRAQSSCAVTRDDDTDDDGK